MVDIQGPDGILVPTIATVGTVSIDIIGVGVGVGIAGIASSAGVTSVDSVVGTVGIVAATMVRAFQGLLQMVWQRR